jgi:hypothetical protein
LSSKAAALQARHDCQFQKNVGNLDEPSSVEAADTQNAMLVISRLQQE